MPIYKNYRLKYNNEKDFELREISLGELFEDECNHHGDGQIEKLQAKINGLCRFIESFCESTPNGRDFLNKYVIESYAYNVSYKYKE